MNEEMKKEIMKALEKNVRFDGRKTDQFRDVKVETDVIKTAEGSALVTIGNTQVMAGVKLGLDTPYPDTPENGNFMVNVELLPMSNRKFEPGPPSINAIELARVTDRGIRESHAVDTKKLCLTPGEKVWSVMIDLCPINAEGNLYDACALAALAALSVTRFPEVNDGVVDYKNKTDKKLELEFKPISVTVLKIGDHLVVDPLEAEEEVYDARLTVTSHKGNIYAMQKGGEAPFSTEEVDAIVDLSMKKADELRKAF